MLPLAPTGEICRQHSTQELVRDLLTGSAADVSSTAKFCCCWNFVNPATQASLTMNGGVSSKVNFKTIHIKTAKLLNHAQLSLFLQRCCSLRCLQQSRSSGHAQIASARSGRCGRKGLHVSLPWHRSWHWGPDIDIVLGRS